MTDQVRVVRLLLVVNDHCLNIGQHILTLAIASILHLALLDALHAAIVLNQAIAAPVVLFIAAGLAHARIMVPYRATVVHLCLHIVTLHGVACSRLLSGVFTLSLLFFFAAIISSIALALLRMEIPLIAVTCLQLVNTLL